MTRKEFSKKYNVDYNIVVCASRRIKDLSKKQRDVQFSENELGLAVCNELCARMHRYIEAAGRIQGDYERMRVICWKAAL